MHSIDTSHDTSARLQRKPIAFEVSIFICSLLPQVGAESADIESSYTFCVRCFNKKTDYVQSHLLKSPRRKSPSKSPRRKRNFFFQIWIRDTHSAPYPQNDFSYQRPCKTRFLNDKGPTYRLNDIFKRINRNDLSIFISASLSINLNWSVRSRIQRDYPLSKNYPA